MPSTLSNLSLLRDLKSSLDRFIGSQVDCYDFTTRYLKSSLDRFIAVDKTA